MAVTFKSSYASSSEENYFDAQENQTPSCRPRHRCLTDFPQLEATESVGPWRTTVVEHASHASCGEAGASDSAWLLIGRRHSVDDRRDAMDRGKAVFLRTLAARVDGAWRTRIAVRAEALQSFEERMHSEVARQAEALEATLAFWAERHASDQAYLARLETCASAALSATLPTSQARQEMEWRTGIQRAAFRSAAWAEQLPRLIASHKVAVNQVRRAITRAVAEAAAASKAVLAAEGAVWPATMPALALKVPGYRSADSAPESESCLWQVARAYLMACGTLHCAQEYALARAHREQRRVVCIGEWVDTVLGRRAEDTIEALSPLPGTAATAEGWAFAEDQDAESAHSGNEDNEEEKALDMSYDISALVVHEQDILVRRNDDAEGAWTPARMLLSVDLWLHLWIPAGLPRDGAPTESLSVARDCLRPVAVVCAEDARTLQFRFRPWVAPGLLEGIGIFLRRDARRRTPLKDLWLQCADAKVAGEVLAVLELVEKMYPILA